MCATTLHTIIFISNSIWMLLSYTVIAQQPLPPIACPQYFQYVSDGFTYYGLITLPQVAVGTAEVRAHFSQRGLPTSNYYGRITSYPDEVTVIRKVLNHQPATFRVDFANPNNPPKLTFISLDGVELCASADYPPPKSWSKLSYQLYTFYTGGNNLTGPNVPISLHHIEIGPRPNYQTTATQHQTNQPLQPTYMPINAYTHQNVPVTMPTNKYDTPTTRLETTTPKPTFNTKTKAEDTSSVNLEEICGREGNVIRGFVYGGIEATRGQFPWLTAIYRKDTDALNFMCGGSLISRRTVISAAHCFKRVQAKQIVLFFGRYDLESYSEEGVVARDVQKMIIHPDYTNDKPNADIALLQIEALQTFSDHIKPICLWSEVVENSLIIGKAATVVGWGYENEKNKDISPLPKMVEVNIVSKDDCLSSAAAFQELITDYTICAGNRDGTGPCMGDSGGALMMQRNGRWMLRGIVSVGQSSRQRCNLYEYVVYCDAAKYMSWVRQNLLE